MQQHKKQQSIENEGLIKLKIKKGLTTQEINYIVEQFLKACEQLDASIFEPLIEEDAYFQDLDKYRFLASLKQQFDWAKNRGAKEIKIQNGVCTLCTRGEKVYEFISNRNQVEFAYNVQIVDGKIKDIFLCNMSTGRQGVKTLEEYENQLLRSIRTPK